ncbi:MAG: hypothetical protein M3Z37_04825 [Candidatus Eremiobacteraeota bacterium]|nr:hypothetical protein [Candidatus Eremiobacteraeota bacterium]
MHQTLHPIRWIAAAFVFAACALAMPQAQAGSGVFSPPPGWVAGSHRGVWIHPDNEQFHQNIGIAARRYDGSLDQFTRSGMGSLRAAFSDLHVGKVQHTTVCGGHAATYLTYTATLGGRSLLYEQMATIWNGVAYLATYTRLNGQPSLPAARAALTSLCGNQSAATGYPAPMPAQRATATPAAADYATPAPVGSIAPTITPRP